MKQTILLIILLGTFNLQAQKTLSLSLGMGYSKPLGNFACDNCSNGGFTYLGQQLHFEANYGIKKLRLKASLNYQHNPIDYQKLIAYYKSMSPGTIWNASGNNHNTYGILLGAGYTFSILDKIEFEPKFMAGLMNTNSPELNIYGENFMGPVGMQLPSSRKWTLSYLLGSEIRYMISPKFSSGIFLNFFTAEETYYNLNVTYYNKPNSIESYSQNIMTLNYGVTIQYQIFDHSSSNQK
jgi:hypothetical protein